MAELVQPLCKLRLSGKKYYTGHFCQAPGCTNTSGKDKYDGVVRSYFSFPLKDKKRLKSWLDAIPRDEWTPKQHERICSDHFKGGPRIWMKWRKELNLAADVTYFALTTLGGFQTLGEEYVNVIQVDPTRRAIPSYVRRGVMIGLQVLTPYAIDKLLSHVEKQLRENVSLRLTPTGRQTLLTAVPVIRHVVMLTHRCHLAVFYLHGAFYHIAKRLSGVHYLRVTDRDGGSSFVYRVLGWLSLIQLSLTLLQQVYAHYKSRQKEAHPQQVVNMSRPASVDDSQSGGGRHRCALCLETRTQTTATPCGHLFCWTCIHEWCAAKPECPLCRQPCESSRLLFLHNYDYR